MISEKSKMVSILNTSEIHFWVISLHNLTYLKNDLYEILSVDEKERVAKIKKKLDKDEFIIRRGLLKILISEYTGKSASKIEYNYGLYGKPSLKESESHTLYFNCSHSAGVAFYGFTRECEIGVDIECIPKHYPYLQIAERFFSNKEYNALMSLPLNEREWGFLTYWTKKEAYLKATGQGFFHPSVDFTIQLNPNISNFHLSEIRVENMKKNWFFDSFTPKKGFIATLASSKIIRAKKFYNNDLPYY